MSQLILLPTVGHRWCSLGDCIWHWLSMFILPRKPKKMHVTLNCCSKNGWLDRQGAKKFSFTSPKVISTSPKKFLMSIGYSSSVIQIPSKNFVCSSCKLRIEITSPVAKSTSPRLSDTTFFACWIEDR